MRIRRVHETPEKLTSPEASELAWKGLPKRTPPPHLTMPVGWLGWLGKPKPAAVFHTPENSYDLLKLDGWMLKYPKKNGPLFRWHSCINRWLGMNGTTVEKRWKKKQPPRVYHGQPTYPAPKIYLYENRFSIHLTLSSLGVFSRKKNRASKCAYGFAKASDSDRSGEPGDGYDMARIQRAPPICLAYFSGDDFILCRIF